jgi:hypothetical protein
LVAVVLPVHGVDVFDVADGVSADRRVAAGVAAGSGHEGEPAVDLEGCDLVVAGVAVGSDQPGYVQATALVVEVSPQQHPEVADLERPLPDHFGGSQAGLH